MNVCEWCEKEFVPKRVKTQAYCSVECRTAKRRVKARIKSRKSYQANREKVLIRKRAWNAAHKDQIKTYMDTVWRPRNGHESRMRHKAKTGHHCACGRLIWGVSRECKACYDKRRAGPVCECGAPRRTGHKQCQACWKRERAALRRCTDRSCASHRTPHRHCLYCRWPIRVGERMCEHCIADEARGAHMGDWYREFEEAA